MFVKNPFWHYALSCFATEPESGSTPTDPPNDAPPADNSNPTPSDTPKLNEHGYPENTPIKEMTADHQAAYWKYHAQKHERRSKEREDYDDLKAKLEQYEQSNMTDAEKQIQQAREEAKAEVAQQYQGRIVDARLRGSLAGRGLDDDAIDQRLSFIDHKAFLSDNGEVDSDKVNAFLDASAPQGKQQVWPDMGGGNRSGGSGKRAGGSLQAGADLYAEKHTK